MKSFSKKTKKFQTVSLASLHPKCFKGKSCVSLSCGRSSKKKVLLPKIGVESLDCDKCGLFMVYGVNHQREETPDFLVYLNLPIVEPLFCFVEFKEQPNTHAVKQLEKGIKVLKSKQKYFSVVPAPKRIECVIARNRKKGTAHAAQLAMITSHVFNYEGQPFTVRTVNMTGKLFPSIDNSYY